MIRHGIWNFASNLDDLVETFAAMKFSPEAVSALRSHLTKPWLWSGLAVVWVIYLFVSAWINYRKLRHVKGPPLAAVSRLWMFWHVTRGTFAEANRAAIRKYGSPCRIAPDVLVTDDSELIRHMNAPGSKWTRSEWYDAMKFDPRQDSVFSTRDERLHAELKAKEANGYNGRDVATLEPDVDANVLKLLRLIEIEYLNRPMDFAEVARFFTMDVLSNVAFGRPFGFMDANADLWKYNTFSEQFMPLLEVMSYHKTVRSIITSPIMQFLAAPKTSDKLGIGRALAFGHAAVAERFGPSPKIKKDMLGCFIEKGLSQKQCEVEAFLQIIAGSDSTTTALRSTIYLLLGNPVAYFRLRAEIDEAVQAGLISSPVVKFSEALKLPYLTACIWESMRMFPPLFGQKQKLAPANGDSFKGTYFPRGCRVGISDHAVCSRQDIFGEDVDYFRPERFLEGDDALQKMRMRHLDVIFASGRFVCLGKRIAMIELYKTVVELVRAFDMGIADPMKGVSNVKRSINMQHNMNIIARRRI